MSNYKWYIYVILSKVQGTLHKKVENIEELEEVEKMWNADFQVVALLNTMIP